MTAVCSAANVEMVRRLGADEVVDYTTEDFVSGAPTCDVIFDNVGNHSFSELRQVPKPDGVVIPNAGTASVRSMLGGMVRSLSLVRRTSGSSRHRTGKTSAR